MGESRLEFTPREAEPFHVFHQEKDLIIFAFYRDYTGSNETERTLFVKKEQDVRREDSSAIIILSKI